MKNRCVVQGSAAFICLTKGYWVALDAEALAYVSTYRWFAQTVKRKDGTVRLVYAIAHHRNDSGVRTTLSMHRLLANAPVGMEVDHRNCNGLDNRRENLRACSASQNRHNQGPTAANRSGFKGVNWNKAAGAWESKIKAGGKSHYLGAFNTAEGAALAYNAAAIALHGEFAHAGQRTEK